METKKRITVKDLARICGVSIGTVDRALNGRGRINPETREKVLSAAKEHGYIKNHLARTLSSGKSDIIGVIVPNLRSEYFSALLTGIGEAARERGLATIFMTSDYSADTERDCALRLLSLNPAGIIVCSVLIDSEFYRDIIKNGTPVAAVANRLEGIPHVGINDYAAAHAAARHIVSHGYGHIYYISPALSKQNQNISAQAERLRGFSDAAAESNVMSTVISSSKELEALSPLGAQKTALMCSSDAYTIRCIVKFRELIEGGQLGLMGFDNLESLRVLVPGIATVSYNTHNIGVAAVRTLFDVSGELFPFTIIEGSTI